MANVQVVCRYRELWPGAYIEDDNGDFVYDGTRFVRWREGVNAQALPVWEIEGGTNG